MSARYRTSILEYISVALVWSHCVPFLMSSFSKVRVTANADNYMNHWNCINYLLTKRLSVQRTNSFAWTHCFLGCQASFNSVRTLLPCYLLSVSQTIFTITCKIKNNWRVQQFLLKYKVCCVKILCKQRRFIWLHTSTLRAENITTLGDSLVIQLFY